MSQQPEVSESGRKLGGGAIASLTGLGVLVTFVLQNTEDVQFRFLFLKFTWPGRRSDWRWCTSPRGCGPSPAW